MTDTLPDSRECILLAAEQEFAAHGLAGARMDRIAAASGFNKALIYYYFKNKLTLYDRVIGFLFDDLDRLLFPALDQARDFSEALDALLDAYFSVFLNRPARARIFARELAAGGDAILRRVGTGEPSYFRHLAASLHQGSGLADDTLRHFLLSTMGLILFPFMARDLFTSVFPPLDEDAFFAARRSEVRRVILAAYGRKDPLPC